MIEVKCPECKKTRKLKCKPKRVTLCRNCSDNARETYNPCIDCGKHRKHHAQGGRCRICYNLYRVAKLKAQEKITYKRVCIDCGDVKEFKYKYSAEKSERCRHCAALVRLRTVPMPKNPKSGEAPAQFKRVCKECGDVRMVRSKQTADKALCRSCGVGNKKGNAHTKRRPKKKGQASQAAIEKVRAINKAHRECVAQIVEVPKQKKTDAEMMAEFLKHNKPTVIESTELKDTGFVVKSGMSYMTGVSV